MEKEAPVRRRGPQVAPPRRVLEGAGDVLAGGPGNQRAWYRRRVRSTQWAVLIAVTFTFTLTAYAKAPVKPPAKTIKPAGKTTTGSAAKGAATAAVVDRVST